MFIKLLFYILLIVLLFLSFELLSRHNGYITKTSDEDLEQFNEALWTIYKRRAKESEANEEE